jgi:hypothetical protein
MAGLDSSHVLRLRVLGFDPGTADTGYGVIDSKA